MATIFSKIIAGEIPCHKIAETKKFFAFLDINPVAKGHTLVIPKKEEDNLFNLDEETYIGLMIFSKYLARAIGDAVPCIKVGMSVIGLEVPHAHLHLVPLNQMEDINFSKEKLKPSQDELAETAAAIRAKL